MQTKDTVRVVLLNALDEGLMIHVTGGNLADPSAPLQGPFWITPGGQMEAGESPEQAVARELWEETGLTGCQVGKMFGYGEQTLQWKGVPTLLRERFYCIRAPHSKVEGSALTRDEQENFQSHKWWSAEAMRNAGELFLPTCMPELIEELASGVVYDGVRTIDLATKG